MSDFAYSVVVAMGRPIIWITSKQTVLHRDRCRFPGPYILASSHLSPYDVAALMAVTPRHLDFLSITEMFKHWFAGRFFTAMNCVFVDRRGPDPSAAHALTAKLHRGRTVAMFPEGGIKTEQTSVLAGVPFKPGVIRLAQLAEVPIIPAVVLGSIGYAKPTAWIPRRGVPFGVNFGEPIFVSKEGDPNAAKTAATEKLKKAYLDLADELRTAMKSKGS